MKSKRNPPLEWGVRANFRMKRPWKEQVVAVKSAHKLLAAALLFCLPLAAGAEWSIGIYTGSSPLAVSPAAGITNPVLTSADVSDASASFVADPFMLFRDGSWHMFFEALTDNGDIAYASSPDGLNWTYQQIVIDESFHMSYPYVFEWQNEIYLVPETWEANAIRLYRATGFPTRWTFVGNMLIGAYRDPSVFRHDGRWWLFTTEGVDRHDTLQLFYADDLLGPWQAHPLSPVIVDDPNIARPGGRVTLFDGRLIRYTQDTYPVYGNKLRAFEITELTTTTYTEAAVVENPILDADGLGWNADGMHHIDPHQLADTSWLAAVDGNGDPNQPDFYGLWLSFTTDRSNPGLLDNAALVQGDYICVYLLPEANVDQVAFSLDGALQQVERYAPYDFAGTGSGGSCKLYDTLALTPGMHTISAEITHLDSSTTNIASDFHIFTGPDVDADGLDNGDELAGGTDPYSADTDGDGLADGSGGTVAVGDIPAAVDLDLDGFADGEQDYGTDPRLEDSDGDGFGDGVEVTSGTDPLDDTSFPVTADGDLNADGLVNVVDVLLAQRILTGQLPLTQDYLDHGDVAPLVGGTPDPDGLFNLGDVLVIQRKALGLIDF
ncbi:MAG: hypothetical protein ACE5FQ_03195 [Thiogranum sp.]